MIKATERFNSRLETKATKIVNEQVTNRLNHKNDIKGNLGLYSPGPHFPTFVSETIMETTISETGPALRETAAATMAKQAAMHSLWTIVHCYYTFTNSACSCH